MAWHADALLSVSGRGVVSRVRGAGLLCRGSPDLALPRGLDVVGARAWLGAAWASLLGGGAVLKHLHARRGGRVALGVGVDVGARAGAVVGGADGAGGGPASAEGMGASDGTARALLVLVEAGLQCLRGTVAAWVRRGTHAVVVPRGCGRGRAGDLNIPAKVGGDRVVAQIAHVVHVGEVRAGRYGGRRSHGCALVRGVVALGSRLCSSGGGSIGTSCEGLGRGPCSILEGARVKALVAGESGATSKRLLAIGIRALVRSASQVDATMARERAAVTEGLCFIVSLLSCWCQDTNIPSRIAHTGEAFHLCAHAGGQ